MSALCGGDHPPQARERQTRALSKASSTYPALPVEKLGFAVLSISSEQRTNAPEGHTTIGPLCRLGTNILPGD
jgi:hypothetical protein